MRAPHGEARRPPTGWCSRTRRTASWRTRPRARARGRGRAASARRPCRSRRGRGSPAPPRCCASSCGPRASACRSTPPSPRSAARRRPRAQPGRVEPDADERRRRAPRAQARRVDVDSHRRGTRPPTPDVGGAAELELTARLEREAARRRAALDRGAVRSSLGGRQRSRAGARVTHSSSMPTRCAPWGRRRARRRDAGRRAW